MPGAKVYDLEENQVNREQAVSKSEITWYLTFLHGEDEKLYKSSLKNMFYFPTFWPVICIFIAASSSQTGIVDRMKSGDAFLELSLAIDLFVLLLIAIFTFSQFVEFMKDSLPTKFKPLIQISKFVLRKFLNGRLEDIIILGVSLSQGFYYLSLISRDLCASCSAIFAVENCLGNDRKLPAQQTTFGYVSILILSIYFKSMNRHIVLLSWLILTCFVIACIIYGSYEFEYVVILLMIFFLVSIYEYERYKMTSYLLSKEALITEKNKVIQMQENLQENLHEKAKIIERKLHMALIHQILPPKVADQIIAGKQVEPELFDEVTIFFSDVVGFTNICSQVSAVEVVRMLNDLYTVMDYCTSLFPLYKVETIGDAYMLVGGLPDRDKSHAQQIADFALLVQKAVQAVKSPVDGSPIHIRIGIHSGSVMAGVVGNLMPRYCLFGDTVNTASRMESNGMPGLIHLSSKTAQILMNTGKYNITKRGEIEVKGKGLLTTYWLDSATDSNSNANRAAIERTEVMVQEVLDASHQEKTYTTSPRPMLQSNEQQQVSKSNGARHSIHYNLTHRSADSFHISNKGNSIHSTGSSSVATSNIAVSSSGASNYEATGAKILVVEDSRPQQKMLVQRLRKADPTWDVSTADNGEDALKKLKAAKLRFDVIFVDENLSMNDGLFGHELVQVMRESFNMVATVIIACTSNPQKVSNDLVAAGVDIVWPKPPPPAEEIRNSIDKLLKQRMFRMTSVVTIDEKAAN